MQNPQEFTTPDIATIPKTGNAPPPPAKPNAKGKMIGQNLSVNLEDCGEASSTPDGNLGNSKPEPTPEELLHQIMRLQEELARRQAETTQQHLLKLTPIQVPTSPLLQMATVPKITPKRRRDEEIPSVPRESPAPQPRPTPEPVPDDNYEDGDLPPRIYKKSRLEDLKDLIRKEVEEAGIKLKQTAPGHLQMSISPLSDEILRVQFPKKFSAPSFEYYRGTSDPMQHLRHY